jgi:hypothetical protein
MLAWTQTLLGIWAASALSLGCGGDAQTTPPRPDPAGEAQRVRTRVRIDGTVSGDEWPAPAMRAEQSAEARASSWTSTNTLSRLWAHRDGTHLYLALEGTLEVQNAWLVYLDVGATHPDRVGSPSEAHDPEGALDVALSHRHLVDPEDFRVDAAWGTLSLEHNAEEWDPRTGWRLFDHLANFSWVSAISAPTVCGSSVCETRIPLAAIGAQSGAPIRLYARLTSADGEHTSNQGLPPCGEDPQVVHDVITLAP